MSNALKEKISKFTEDTHSIINFTILFLLFFGGIEALIVYSGSRIESSISRLSALLQIGLASMFAGIVLQQLRIIDLTTEGILGNRKLGNILIALIFGLSALTQIPTLITGSAIQLSLRIAFVFMTAIFLLASIELFRKPSRGIKMATVAASLLLTQRIIELYIKPEFFNLYAASLMAVILVYLYPQIKNQLRTN